MSTLLPIWFLINCSTKQRLIAKTTTGTSEMEALILNTMGPTNNGLYSISVFIRKPIIMEIHTYISFLILTRHLLESPTFILEVGSRY